ncbi:MAG: hypothetical protein LE178_05990 [Endomicrobium sp.]|nr:hypothetical protein [Endomicrobium sp.]
MKTDIDVTNKQKNNSLLKAKAPRHKYPIRGMIIHRKISGCLICFLLIFIYVVSATMKKKICPA